MSTPQKASKIAMKSLPPEALPHVAAYFQVLSEPGRLQILNILRGGERSVGELAEMTSSSPANTSRHLAMMAQHGFVVRQSRGTSAYYAIEDQAVFALCDLVCGSIAQRLLKADKHKLAFGLSSS